MGSEQAFVLDNDSHYETDTLNYISHSLLELTSQSSLLANQMNGLPYPTETEQLSWFWFCGSCPI